MAFARNGGAVRVCLSRKRNVPAYRKQEQLNSTLPDRWLSGRVLVRTVVLVSMLTKERVAALMAAPPEPVLYSTNTLALLRASWKEGHMVSPAKATGKRYFPCTFPRTRSQHLWHRDHPRTLTASQERRQKGQQGESPWHYDDLVPPRLMSDLSSPAVASEETEANPSDPTAIPQRSGREQVPSDQRSHERGALSRDKKHRKAEHGAAARWFLDLPWRLPLPSIFTMGMEG